MEFNDYIITVILSLLSVYLGIRAIIRNKKIVFRGYNNLILIIISAIAILAFPIEIKNNLLIMKNILIYLLLAIVAFTKKGIAHDGIYSLFKTAKWKEITEIYVEPVELTGFRVLVKKKNNSSMGLSFKTHQLSEILEYMAKNVPDVKVDSRLMNK